MSLIPVNLFRYPLKTYISWLFHAYTNPVLYVFAAWLVHYMLNGTMLVEIDPEVSGAISNFISESPLEPSTLLFLIIPSRIFVKCISGLIGDEETSFHYLPLELFITLPIRTTLTTIGTFAFTSIVAGLFWWILETNLAASHVHFILILTGVLHWIFWAVIIAPKSR
ncbi:MAG: hypothetical protein FWG68_06290 [Defluviitaleaceae bacterium]|nr:hypothetical protein [Defluviitaleaceae bacterium]